MVDLVAPTGSPFWIRLHGTWLQLEGATPGVAVDGDRPRSEFRSVDGNRYVQRGPQTRRQWDLSIPYAASAAQAVAVLRAAVEAEDDVMFVSDDQLVTNMLPSRSCYGTTSPAIVCGSIPLLTLAPSQVVTGRVRGGVATTLSCWTTASPGATALNVNIAGGALIASCNASAGGRASVTFTRPTDTDIEIVASSGSQRSTGLMMAEVATLPTAFVHGEGSGMPCKVEVQDPGDTLTMRRDGYWRHSHQVTIREVG